jgi:hypothetical protein
MRERVPEYRPYQAEQDDPRFDNPDGPDPNNSQPWIASDPHNPCREWRRTGKHCSRCPYDPVCNE